MNQNIDLTTASLLDKLKKSKTDDESVKEIAEGLNQQELDLIAQLYAKQSDSTSSNDKNVKSFLPKPGFCLKTKNSTEEKIFINICQSDQINAPKDISEQQLIKLIEQEDAATAAFQYRVPMSLGEPHSELDNSGCACVAYDVCINDEFLKKVNENSTFMGFLMSIVIEGLETKYSIKLDRNCKMLKNKKFLGKIQQQFVRVKSKPLISEVDKSFESTKTSELSCKETKHAIPNYKIIREPQEGKVEFLVAEIQLPQIISAKSIELDIGEDRILLNTRSGVYCLDIYLPYNLNQEECGAEFDKKSKVLTITMPVIST